MQTDRCIDGCMDYSKYYSKTVTIDKIDLFWVFAIMRVLENWSLLNVHFDLMRH